MRPTLAALAATGATLMLVAGSANALICYRIIDRADHVVYQDLKPPVDMSDSGAPERAALRARGGFLMIIDTDQCFELTFDKVLLADARPKTVDDIVSNYRQFANSGGASRGGSPGSRGGSVPAPAQSSSSPTSRY